MTLRQAIRKCMDSPERWVLKIDYVDRKNRETVRVISPTCWLNGSFVFRALCLGREDTRAFHVASVRRWQVIPAHEVLMPVEIEEASGEKLEASKEASRE
jgi:predicted DNA-binding transcriptional regulator YafY